MNKKLAWTMLFLLIIVTVGSLLFGKLSQKQKLISAGIKSLYGQMELIQTMQEQLLLADGEWQRELTERLAEEYLIAGGAECMLSKEINAGYNPVGWRGVSRKLRELSDTGEIESSMDFIRELIQINEKFMKNLENYASNVDTAGRYLVAWRADMRSCMETNE